MLLVDAEYNSRHNNNIKRLIKSVEFSDSHLYFLGTLRMLWASMPASPDTKPGISGLPELFSELETARIQGKYQQVMKQFQKHPLVILDEFLLIPVTNRERRPFLGPMEYRCNQAVHDLLFPFHARGFA